MSAIGRGNVGAAIFETFHVTDDADAPEPAELVVMWHLPTVGEPQVGCRIGSAGSFSSMDAEAQCAMIDDVNHHSTRPQQRSLLGYAVSSSMSWKDGVIQTPETRSPSMDTVTYQSK